MTTIIEHEWAQRKHVNLQQIKHESTKRNDTTFLLLKQETQWKRHSLCLCSHLHCWTMCSTSCKDPIPSGWLPQLLPDIHFFEGGRMGVESKGRGKSECIMTQRQKKNSRIHADMYGDLEKSYDHESWVADLSSESKSPGFVLAKSLFRSWNNHAHTSSLASLADTSCRVDGKMDSCRYHTDASNSPTTNPCLKSIAIGGQTTGFERAPTSESKACRWAKEIISIHHPSWIMMIMHPYMDMCLPKNQ